MLDELTALWGLTVLLFETRRVTSGERTVRPQESHRGDSRLADKRKLKDTTQLSGDKSKRAKISRVAGNRKRPSLKPHQETEGNSYSR